MKFVYNGNGCKKALARGRFSLPCSSAFSFPSPYASSFKCFFSTLFPR